jgi:hypothetical protein
MAASKISIEKAFSFLKTALPQALEKTENAMDSFLHKHADKITGTLFCPDRLIFKGYLPFTYPRSMEGFLADHDVLLKDFKDFGPQQAVRIKEHARQLADQSGCTFRFLERKVRKEELARQLAQQQGLREGLVAVFSTMETCPSFRILYGKGRPHLKKDFRRCLVLYFYFLDPEFGLLHVRLPTWFPLTIQVYLNGHEWLARQLDHQQLRYQRRDNAFLFLETPDKVQELADRFLRKKWPGFLNMLAKRCNPLLGGLLKGLSYQWVTDQAEFALDILFKDKAALASLYPRLLHHAALHFSGEDILSYFGRQRPQLCVADVVGDLKKQHQGFRVKHRFQGNWIKMYDKFAQVLRIEVVINRPGTFRVRRWGTHQGKRVFGWHPLIKNVALLPQYAHVAHQVAGRYVNGLAVVVDPQVSQDLLDRACSRASFAGRKRRALNPLSRQDQQLFFAVLRGEHALRGFRSRDLAAYLNQRPSKDPQQRRRDSAQRSRLLQLLRAHGLIAKLPHTRRYRVTDRGLAFMSAAIQVRHNAFPDKMDQVA